MDSKSKDHSTPTKSTKLQNNKGKLRFRFLSSFFVFPMNHVVAIGYPFT